MERAVNTSTTTMLSLVEASAADPEWGVAIIEYRAEAGATSQFFGPFSSTAGATTWAKEVVGSGWILHRCVLPHLAPTKLVLA